MVAHALEFVRRLSPEVQGHLLYLGLRLSVLERRNAGPFDQGVDRTRDVGPHPLDQLDGGDGISQTHSRESSDLGKGPRDHHQASILHIGY